MKQFLFLLIFPVLHGEINRGYHQLKWTDFEGKRPAGDVITAAQLCIEINWGTSSESDPAWNLPLYLDSVMSFECRPYMNPENSFITSHDLFILKHEQGHFDICLIECRKINKIAALGKHYLSTTWEKFRDSAVKKWNQTDSIYDAETDHSLNKEAQVRWNLWIAEQLKNTK